ncbi:Retrovirus-related Pol polyprotein from transposon TNT 1-94 [Sesamum angolense]|uniref:Retrovirus-related Pol polyprotein from transposon TNT 1-94 n=1 Tax=Sesamum angolense TaxID=2727404 RepID=A0AAE1WQT4_9LAMI|nr:Retrovirus-related Pol polyprotein from transposon TNT 1-94 [Sesamum angolense]
MNRLVDSESLEIDNLDNLPADVCTTEYSGQRGFSYFITFTDDHSWYGYVYLMRPSGQYQSGEFIDYLKEYGIVSQLTPPGTPQLNGVAERRNRTLFDMIRSTMSFIELSLSFWVYALETAASPTYVKRLVGDKLDSRSSLCRFIGYPKETAGYYFYDPFEQKVFVLRNAVFLERGFPTDTRRDELLFEESSKAPQSNVGTSSAPTVSTDNVPILRSSARVPQPPERFDSGKWLEAMNSEMDSMSSNQVWILVDRPKGVKLVGCKLVYKCKIGADGEVTTFKPGLVAKGYTQRPGVDFEETFSPVAMAKSIRIMLATAAWYDYEIWQMDVKTASLNDFVEEEIYMDQLEGFRLVGEEQKGYDFVKNDFDPCVYKKDVGHPYASALGSIQYIVQCTRPDIAYALSVTSRYQACVGEAHWTAVKTILMYLKMTKDVFLVYGAGELILEGFSDASFQSDDDDAKSQSGFIFKLYGGVVAWKSSKQDTTTNSTKEAEYIVVLEAAKEAVWMKNYIEELGLVPSIAKPVVIVCDNNGAKGSEI